MARKRGVMSEALKYELAQELGVDHIVRTEGWGGVTSRQCGNLITLAIQRAQRDLQSPYPDSR
ncbi:MAG: small, acid-soluble spore protein, alpha/beta type [Syntrophomonadaceae bacterium]|nr:small, acid-soluble spore protein, alpha/beta type [Syntrophomonadaceae bacterium]